jgi:hypothetical protein
MALGDEVEDLENRRGDRMGLTAGDQVTAVRHDAPGTARRPSREILLQLAPEWIQIGHV